MASAMDEQILRAVKEIVVKFIETGRISPTTFHESFKSIYRTVQEAVEGAPEASAASDPASEKAPKPAD